MRALVTGGAGLIGSHIADLLYKQGYKIRILDNLEKETHLTKPAWIKKEYEFIKGDVKNKKIVEAALKNVDYIFHQAAYGGFTPKITKFIQSNCIGTANIFEAIRDNKFKIKKVVVASSQAVYGEGKYKCKQHGTFEPSLRPLKQLQRGDWEVKCPVCKKDSEPFPVDEERKINPGLTYSISKYCEEKLALISGQALGIPTVALRYALTYGPRQSLSNPYTGVTSIFSTHILNNIPIEIHENGHQARDFTYVEDVARANYVVSQTPKSDYQVFNVSTQKLTSILQFIKTLNKAYGTNLAPIIHGKYRPGDARYLYLDNSKLQKLGWKPITNLENGIEKYVSWIRNQQTSGDLKEYFSAVMEKLMSSGIIRQSSK